VLDLDGRVVDFEVPVEALANRCDEAIVYACVRANQMNGESGLSGAHRPNVEVMHLGHTGQVIQVCFYAPSVYVFGHSIKREIDG
jgi:hypothetical protein